ncbi:MAG: DUF4240 domain-containing protein [Oscillospiraceae bacterium]|nr:DUF4240 domain-containing protein [Oscillospiraceae bacterium]
MREMSKDDFWNLIADMKKDCGQDMNASIRWMKDQLTALGPQQAQDFHDILHGYRDMAKQYGLWSAASIMCDGCSDDGFIDFRAWLIAQGREVYLEALKNPDSLADVEPYGGCQFELLSYAGSYALEALTGHDAYHSDPLAYDALVAELERDIVFGEGIGYPYELDEIAGAFPRLCGKYLTPEDLSIMARYGNTWNLDNEQIRAARAAGPKNAPVRRTWDQSAFQEGGSKTLSERDVENVITGMRAETFREIQNDRSPPAKQLAWYWSYIGSLDMAQELGLITDARRQALCHEAERFKPDCVVTARELEQQAETAMQMQIGGMT